jgi:hypothetical protein
VSNKEDHQPHSDYLEGYLEDDLYTQYLEHDVLWAAPIYGDDEEWCVRKFAACAVTAAQETRGGHAHVYVLDQEDEEEPCFVIASRRPLTRDERQGLLEEHARTRAATLNRKESKNSEAK